MIKIESYNEVTDTFTVTAVAMSSTFEVPGEALPRLVSKFGEHREFIGQEFDPRFETSDFVVELFNITGENKEFQYEVFSGSSNASVSFSYEPIDEEPEEDGRYTCDVDVRAGGDCVHPRDLPAYITAAWEAHDFFKLAAHRFTESY